MYETEAAKWKTGCTSFKKRLQCRFWVSSSYGCRLFLSWVTDIAFDCFFNLVILDSFSPITKSVFASQKGNILLPASDIPSSLLEMRWISFLILRKELPEILLCKFLTWPLLSQGSQVASSCRITLKHSSSVRHSSQNVKETWKVSSSATTFFLPL